jgi:hypothetical protein
MNHAATRGTSEGGARPTPSGPLKLHDILKSLPTVARRHESTYQAACLAERLFASYPSARSLFDALSEKSPLPLSERQSLVVALAVRHRATRHPLWQSLLLRAFAPMLLGLRAQTWGGTRADCDQRVLLSFLRAIAVRDVWDGPVFLFIRQDTVRLLARAARKERVHAKNLSFDEAPTGCMPSPHVDPAPFVACLAHEIASQIVRREGEDVLRMIVDDETPSEQHARLSATDRTVSRKELYARQRGAIRRLRAKYAGRDPGQS